MSGGNGVSQHGEGGQGKDPSGEEIDPETLARLVQAIDIVMRRRRISLVGYGLAILVLLIGFPIALGFLGRYGWLWVLTLPPIAAASIIYFFGKWVRSIKLKPPKD